MDRPISGITYLFSGFSLITKPGIRLFVVIPLLINIILFIGFFLLLSHFMQVFNQWLAHFLPTWLQWLKAIFWLLFFVGFFVILMYTFVTLANLVSAPFNSFLAEKVEYYLTGQNPEPRSLWDNIKDLPRIVGRQFAILGYYLPRALLLLILFFVPVIQLIAPFLAFLFHAWLMTLTYMDYPTDNHRIPIMRVREWLYERRLLSVSFGASVLVLTMLPLINLFIIPAAVAAATKLWVDESKRA